MMVTIAVQYSTVQYSTVQYDQNVLGIHVVFKPMQTLQQNKKYEQTPTQNTKYKIQNTTKQPQFNQSKNIPG
jgi:hypothetical protein